MTNEINNLSLEELNEYKEILEKLIVEKEKLKEQEILAKKLPVKKKKQQKANNKSREKAYIRYETYLKTFEIFFGGVSTKKQLVKLFVLVHNLTEKESENVINRLNYYLLINREQFQDNRAYYFLNTFSRIRIYNDKNKRTATVAPAKYHSRYALNFIILEEIEKYKNNNAYIKIADAIINNKYQGINNSLIHNKYKDSGYRKKVSETINEVKDHIVKTKNFEYDNKDFTYFLAFNTLSNKDVFNVLYNYINLFKKNKAFEFYYYNFLEQLYLYSLKKKITSRHQPKILDHAKDKEELEEFIKYNKRVKELNEIEVKELRVEIDQCESFNLKDDMRLGLADIELRGFHLLYILPKTDSEGNLYLKFVLCFIDRDSNLDGHRLQQQTKHLQDLFNSIFSSPLKSYEIEVYWVLKTDIYLDSINDRIQRISEGRGNRFGSTIIHKTKVLPDISMF